MPIKKPILGITMGDAAGIGPEVVAKVFAERKLWEHSSPLVIGDSKIMENAISLAKTKLKLHLIEEINEARFEEGTMDILEIPVLKGYNVKIGKVDPKCGEASVTYVKTACQLALEGKIHATTSAPVNKEAMHAAGYNYEGQAEIFAEMCKVKNYTMMLMSGNVRLFFVTNHLPLKEVVNKIDKNRVYTIIKLANKALIRQGLKEPKIAVSGLNPHAGDGGLLGQEEIQEIAPAIKQAQAERITAIGPIPPDTVFIMAREGRYDAVISMYHDHGTTAMKLLGFKNIVTVLVGLPIIRTSVGHGTAFDIAGKGIADHTNLLEATLVANTIGRVRT
ncbi:MAG: 4-hydroxythreonine-4-phosphate dehydrogenase PdxA [Planctomycetes bacterium]|nr:4-hydroxythreonine-4-phosphate dehydrogenase PdxA [Planctomycetota bacterium]